MKITVEQSILIAGLTKVQSAVSSRPTIPVLSNILFVAEDGILKLTATDLEVSISTSIEAEVTTPGKTTLPAKKFIQFIRQFPSDKITIDTDENHVSNISCQGIKHVENGLSDAEFPSENDIADARSFTFESMKLKKMMDKISYSVSNDETRLVLNGIFLSIRQGTLTAVATDGRRMALMESLIDSEEDTDGDTILPSKAVSELAKVLSADGNVTVQLGDVYASFEVGNTKLQTKLIEGTYPNYRQVIPASFSQQIAIPREKFNTALQCVSPQLTETSSAVKIAMTAAEIVVSATSNSGTSSAPVGVSYDGEETAISFNPTFIMDPLRKLENDEVILKFNDKISPIGLYGDEGFLYIIMPMRN